MISVGFNICSNGFGPFGACMAQAIAQYLLHGRSLELSLADPSSVSKAAGFLGCWVWVSYSVTPTVLQHMMTAPSIDRSVGRS